IAPWDLAKSNTPSSSTPTGGASSTDANSTDSGVGAPTDPGAGSFLPGEPYPGASTKVLRAYVFNPEFRAVYKSAQQDYIEDEIIVTVPWRAASWVDLSAGRLRLMVFANFYKA